MARAPRAAGGAGRGTGGDVHPPDPAQRCCLLEGMTRLLSFAPGDFAVVLHSEPDCANLVLRDGRVVDAGRFFCSNLSEADAIGGRSRARLAAAVREAVERRRPSAVFVVGGCVAGLVADDAGDVVASLRLPRGVRVVALDGGAFTLHGQAEVVDRFTGVLAEAAPRRARKVARSVGLVGFPPDGGEATGILGRAGIAVRAWPQLDSPQVRWNALSGASAIVISDGRLFGRLAGILASRHGVPVIELPPPVGAEGSARWYAGLAAHLGPGAAMRRAFRRERAAAGRAVAAFRRRFAGRKLAYHVGGRKDFELWTLVRDGLAFVPALRELGLRVELLFQGAVEEAQRRRIEALLAHHDLDLPYRCLPDRVSLAGELQGGRFDAVYCCDSLREEAGAAGVPIVAAGSLRTGFAGAEANAAVLAALLERGR
ncbi:MAG: hypothetical protein HY905_26775 [Deltaproteobacteria bacterium]|nr:hypothetical protein [Deltaproteobacteria bacterium]